MDGCTPDYSKCWLWLGSKCGRNGRYGQININGRKYKSHRIAFRLHYRRSIPFHLDGGHTCDTPECNNPTHVRPTSHRRNVQEWYFRYGGKNSRHEPPRPTLFLPLTDTERIA